MLNTLNHFMNYLAKLLGNKGVSDGATGIYIGQMISLLSAAFGLETSRILKIVLSGNGDFTSIMDNKTLTPFENDAGSPDDVLAPRGDQFVAKLTEVATVSDGYLNLIAGAVHKVIPYVAVSAAAAITAAEAALAASASAHAEEEGGGDERGEGGDDDEEEGDDGEEEGSAQAAQAALAVMAQALAAQAQAVLASGTAGTAAPVMAQALAAQAQAVLRLAGHSHGAEVLAVLAAQASGTAVPVEAAQAVLGLAGFPHAEAVAVVEVLAAAAGTAVPVETAHAVLRLAGHSHGAEVLAGLASGHPQAAQAVLAQAAAVAAAQAAQAVLTQAAQAVLTQAAAVAQKALAGVAAAADSADMPSSVAAVTTAVTARATGGGVGKAVNAVLNLGPSPEDIVRPTIDEIIRLKSKIPAAAAVSDADFLEFFAHCVTWCVDEDFSVSLNQDFLQKYISQVWGEDIHLAQAPTEAAAAAAALVAAYQQASSVPKEVRALRARGDKRLAAMIPVYMYFEMFESSEVAFLYWYAGKYIAEGLAAQGATAAHAHRHGQEARAAVTTARAHGQEAQAAQVEAGRQHAVLAHAAQAAQAAQAVRPRGRRGAAAAYLI